MKLLNRTLRNYVIFSTILLLIAVPAFSFIINDLYIKDIDDELLHKKQGLELRLKKLSSEAELQALLNMEGNIEIRDPKKTVLHDSLFKWMVFDSLENSWEPYRALAGPITLNDKQKEVRIRIPLKENGDLIINIVKLQSLIMVMLFGGMVLINRLISQRVWQPFYNTLNKLRQYDIDKKPVLNLDKTPIHEFEDLNKTVIHLIRHNQQVFQNQKEFTENASHELQTPLAIIRGQLDMLTQSEALTEDQAGIIETLYSTVNRLSKILKSLILLSKIDNEQFIEMADVDIGKLIEQLLIPHAEQIENREIHIKQDNISRLVVRGNYTLLEVLLNNMLGNAIRHNIDNGEITITVHGNKLTIANTGKILNVPIPDLFQRFKKDNQNPLNMGLGLSIVKKICDIHGYGINYSYANSWHIIEITFNEKSDLPSPEL